jgi:hypothetical protein
MQLSLTQPRDVRNAWIAWALLIVGVCALVTASGNRRTVTPAYRGAAQSWFAGEDLYDDTGRGFLYLPQSAILFSPLAYLPFPVAEVLWRVINIGVFVWGVRRLAGLVERDLGVSAFPLISIFAGPLALACCRNGQMTLAMAGLMMLAVAMCAERRWNAAAIALGAALALKPLAIVLWLLAAAIHRPLRGRLAVAGVLVALLPFATQWPNYVWRQYADCLGMLGSAAQLGANQQWAQFFGMLGCFGVDAPPMLQTLTRLAAAGATLALCLLARKRLPQATADAYLYVLAATYLMLFNPRTENNTYAMLGPALGVLAAPIILVERRKWAALLLGFIAFGTLGSYEIGKLLTPGSVVWLAPAMTVCFVGLIVQRLLRRGESQEIEHTRESPETVTVDNLPRRAA